MNTFKLYSHTKTLSFYYKIKQIILRYILHFIRKLLLIIINIIIIITFYDVYSIQTSCL